MKSIFSVLSGIFWLLCTAASVSAQPAAKATVDNVCSKCHNTARIYKASKNMAGWNKTLGKMITKGAAIQPSEKDAVARFLNTVNR